MGSRFTFHFLILLANSRRRTDSFRAMLNYIWLGLIVLAVIIGGCTDNLKAVADKSFEMAEFAVMKTALPLVGIMALWLGIMRLAERAGLGGLAGARCCVR